MHGKTICRTHEPVFVAKRRAIFMERLSPLLSHLIVREWFHHFCLSHSDALDVHLLPWDAVGVSGIRSRAAPCSRVSLARKGCSGTCQSGKRENTTAWPLARGRHVPSSQTYVVLRTVAPMLTCHGAVQCVPFFRGEVRGW